MEELALRTKVRNLLDIGNLPNRRPDRTWGGPGVGGACAICALPVGADQIEYEMEFAHDGDNPSLENYHVHIGCFAAWEFERRRDKH